VLDIKKAINDDVHIHLSFRTNNPRFEEIYREQLEIFKRRGCLVSHLSSYGNIGGLVKSDEAKGVSIADGSRMAKNETCVFPLLMLSVLSDGLVTACGCVDFNGDSLIVGGARTDTISECWRSERMKNILNSFPKGTPVDLCRQCSLYRGITHFASPIFKNVRSYKNLPLEFYMIYGG
jgi:hypothetical protein